MGFPTKLQLIKRKKSQQWYVNFPSALAQAMDFGRGEVVEWAVEDRTQLVLNRPQAPPSPLKKTPPLPAPGGVIDRGIVVISTFDESKTLP